MRLLKSVALAVVIAMLFLGCAKRQVVQLPIEEPEDISETRLQEKKIIEPNLDRIFFDFDKSDIRSDAATTLSENARILKLYPDMKITVEGHCCEIGTAEYNFALGERRANASHDYLRGLGISLGRISTISYGEEKPFDPSTLSKNRRCEFVSNTRR